MNWSTYWVGSRTQWNVTRDFYLGLDVMYARLQSASTPGNVAPAAFAPASSGVTTVSDMDNWQFRFRAHRDFYP
jgi:hypothetical protein